MTRRGRAVAGALAALCLVAALLLAGAARPTPDHEADRAADAGPSRDGASTPLWSARRVPELVARRASAPVLASDLASAGSGHDACATATDGDVAVDVGGGARTPASTLKLLTGAAALHVLGPDHRLRTEVRGPAPVDGLVSGDLVLVGGGDPGIVTPAGERAQRARPRFATTPLTRLTDLADAIVAAGVVRVDGSVVGDDSRHDRVRYPPEWKPNYRTEGQSGPLGALAVDQGFDPPASATAVADPALHAAEELVVLLAERGVVVERGATSAPRGAPAATVVASLASAPLHEVVAGSIAASDNFVSELLAREVGRAVRGDASTPAGAEAVLATAAELGVPVEGAVALDGSGLAPGNRLTCATVLAALRLGSRPGFEALDRGLAVAGRTGTLATRFACHELEGRLRAKTGQLAGVVALSGTVDDGDGLDFAFLASGTFSVAGGQQLQADVATAVARYPAVGPDVVPRPG